MIKNIEIQGNEYHKRFVIYQKLWGI